MKKSILFIVGTLDSGGVAKSLVNLLNAIDCQKQDVHLLIMHDVNGPFQRFIPQEVEVHHLSVASCLLEGLNGVRKLLMNGRILLALLSILRMALSRIDKPSAGWLLAHLFPSLDGNWDVIVDFNGQQQLYYMVDKLKGKCKITFFHNDYYMWRYYERMDRRYFKRVDKIYSISEKCVQSLKEIFPEVKHKIFLQYNISLPSMIHAMAAEHVNLQPFNGVLLVTVGHVCERKGIDIAIEAANVLKNKNIPYLWLWLGTNDDKRYSAQIEKLRLYDNMKFLGVISNPYPYMKKADIIVHPSRFEGKSMTLDEAKLLCKPIVVTNYSTVHDQFENRKNATICELNGLALASAIEELLSNTGLMKFYRENLALETADYSNSIVTIDVF